MTDDTHPTSFDNVHPMPSRTRAKRRTAPPHAVTHRPLSLRAAGITVRQAVASYLLARTEYAASTRAEHGDILRRFAAWTEERRWPALGAVTNNHLRAWLTGLNDPSAKTGKPLSKARKNKCGAVVRTFVKWAIAEGIADEHLTKNVRWPAAPKLTDSMIAASQEDLTRLLAACDPHTWHGIRDFAIVTVLYDTGVRRGELLAMRLPDVETLSRPGAIVSGKSGTRAVGYGTAARRALRDYLDRARYAIPTDHDMLWIAWDGQPLGAKSIGLMLNRLKKRAGIEGRIYPHKIRHTFATDFLRAGGNAYALQLALGHTSPIVTSNYVHLAAADVERAMQQHSPADRLTRRPRPTAARHSDRHGVPLSSERVARGERHGSAKLDWETVRTIRARLAAGGITQAALADEYDVAKSTLNALVRGETWRE